MEFEILKNRFFGVTKSRKLISHNRFFLYHKIDFVTSQNKPYSIYQKSIL